MSLRSLNRRYTAWLTRRRNRLIVGVPSAVLTVLVAVVYLQAGTWGWIFGAWIFGILALWVFLPRFGATRW